MGCIGGWDYTVHGLGNPAAGGIDFLFRVLCVYKDFASHHLAKILLTFLL